MHRNRERDPVLGKKTGSGALYLKRREFFFKVYLMNILDNFKKAFFSVFIFSVSDVPKMC